VHLLILQLGKLMGTGCGMEESGLRLCMEIGERVNQMMGHLSCVSIVLVITIGMMLPVATNIILLVRLYKIFMQAYLLK